MSNSENLLIDLNNSSSNDNCDNVKVKQEVISTDTISLMRSSVPIYKLLNADGGTTIEFADNNPFDKMDKQAELFNDPFESVSNAAAASSNTTEGTSMTNVETGLLVSIDSPTESDRKAFFQSDTNVSTLSATTHFSASQSNHTDGLFNISPISSRSKQYSLNGLDINFGTLSKTNETSYNRTDDNFDTLFSIKTEYSPTIDTKPIGINSTLISDVNNSVQICKQMHKKTNSVSPKSVLDKSMNDARNSGRAKTNSLNLLKYSLSNSRGESGTDASPPVTSYEGSLNEPSMSFSQLSKYRSSINESFEDLSATKPNWIDSLTDIDIDTELDNDMEKMNFPMLNKSLGELDIKSDPEKVDDSVEKLPKKCPTPSIFMNRDILLKKLESIKHNIPSPAINFDRQQADDPKLLNNIMTMTKQEIVADDSEPRTPTNQYSTIPDVVKNELAHNMDLKSEKTNLLMQNLKMLVEQCDDKGRQEEAKNLLKSLSTILATENKPIKCENESTPPAVQPQPMVRQGTFSIDKNENSDDGTDADDATKNNTEINAERQYSNCDDNMKPGVRSPEACAVSSEEENPGLAHVIKELQQMWGNQAVNVLQTNITASTSASNINPTYIVLMGTPASNELAQISASSNFLNRSYRSHSLSATDRPAAAIRAAQIAAQLQHQQQQQDAKPSKYETPLRSSLNRRCSFGASNTVIKERTSISNYTPLRRRSIQCSATATVTPLTRSHLSTSIASNVSPLPAITRRRSLLTSPLRDSPQKIRSVKPTIMKPPAPPATRSLKIRVKESLGGRSTAPLRAMVPMNRVAPLNMINESVKPIANSSRRSLVTSTPILPATKLAATKNERGKC